MSMDTTTKYKPYPAYKESGVEWLGEVPEHWEVKRLKYNLRLLNEKTDRRENPIALENIQSWSGRFIPTETLFEGEGVAFSPGDILFGKLRPYLAKAILTEFYGEAVGDFFVMRPSQNVNGNFILYQILNKEFISIVDGSTFGAKMPRVSWEFMSGMILAMPPDDEQHTIAAFLDRETAKIDTLIAQQERLIKLLQEKRTALISHAVTKGLNPDAPMKESGVEWLGEVPEHWKTSRLRFLAIVNPSKSEVAKLPPQTEVSFIPMEAISEDGELSLDQIREIEAVYNGFTYFREEDVLVAKITPCFENGKGALAKGLVNSLGFGTTELHVLRAKESINSKFLWWITKTEEFRKFGEILMKGAAGQQRVPDDFIKNWTIGFPLMDEQQTIVAFLDCETTKIDTLIAKTRHAIGLLKERRTALISAAVTGKIDVREV